MAAYLIGQVTIHDSAEFEKYVAGFMEVTAPFEGRPLVATDDFEVLEGNWPRTRTVVVEFSLDRTREALVRVAGLPIDRAAPL